MEWFYFSHDVRSFKLNLFICGKVVMQYSPNEEQCPLSFWCLSMCWIIHHLINIKLRKVIGLSTRHQSTIAFTNIVNIHIRSNINFLRCKFCFRMQKCQFGFKSGEIKTNIRLFGCIYRDPRNSTQKKKNRNRLNNNSTMV